MVVGVSGCAGGDGESTDQRSGARGPSTPATELGSPELAERADPLPVVTPTPRAMRWLGPDVAVPAAVTLEVAAGVDDATTDAVSEVLGAAGASDVAVIRPEAETGASRAAPGGAHRPGARAGELTVRVGSIGDEVVGAELRAVGLDVPGDLPAEGYALAAFRRAGGTATVVLAGTGPAGTFYAAQTLRQLTSDGTVAGVGVVDHPAMRHRGTIEGFYGRPWTTEERLDQLAFYGRFKLNTYVYAPKDDPYHRDRWREPYPADQLATLRALVEAAATNHVRFTFALSPGVSICYSDPADHAALTAKLDAVYRLGARSFSIALDDIDHTRWNCAADGDRYGQPSTEAAAEAQVELLNALYDGFVAEHEGVSPLQMVPTEYRGTDDSAYRRVLRAQLHPEVEVMWTGPYVVPAEITIAQAERAASVFGRPVFVWDNTPVNDYAPTEGRLILAPYARREPGLGSRVSGIVLNPMNQAAASKVQVVGAADFAWNDAAYDPAIAHRAAADHLAGGDPRTVEALLAFFDVEHLAPTSASSGLVSQPQAPALAAQLDAFRTAWAGADPPGKQAALAGLRPHADRLAGAPALIRAQVADAGFLSDCGPWLDATALWGQAFVATLDGLGARLAGDWARATQKLTEAGGLMAQAEAIRTIPGETRPEGPVRVADGVLDAFLRDAPSLI
jgi:hyaluronoglucosaminidase